VVKASEIGEFGLIDRIRARKSAQDEDVVLGIGDDCAVLRRGPVLEVLTTDCLVEGSHYEVAWLSMADIGWKALAVNVSDIAAVGGTPKHALVTLLLPDDFTTRQIDDLYDGLEACGKETGVVVVGGDIVRTTGPFAISVALAGICERDELVLRSGARSGDTIVVTGTLGDASVGLRHLKERGVDKQAGPESEAMKVALERFRRPVPRLKESRVIIQELQPTSMIDVSDGLLSDLWHILEGSNVGALLESGDIPVGPGVVEFFAGSGEEALSQAMAGGEDYELLFTVGSRGEARLAEVSERAGVKLTPIGKITAKGEGMKLSEGGRETDIGRGGFDHFKSVS
jgi:thiamine-monophosphate kinase